MRETPVVAIDGPSGVGKSTVARSLAAELGLPHLDTGGLYRAATLAVMRAGVDPTDEQGSADVVGRADIRQREGRTFLDGEDVEEEIRGDAVDALVSVVSAHPKVREAMLPIQRDAVRGRGGVVEGRDIGSVVFPDAALKIFLTAHPEERARRRATQRGAPDTRQVARQLSRRDAYDSQRAVAPLTKAEDAWEIDTTAMTQEEVIQGIAALARAVWGQEQRDAPAAAGTGTPGVPSRSSAPRTIRRVERAGSATAAGAVGDRSGPRVEGEAVPVDDRVGGEGGQPETKPRRELEVEGWGSDGELVELEAVGDGADAAGAEPPPVPARSRLPRVAVVGRPNVGKSTLVNRVLGRRAAIVEERPGVTRDVTEHVTAWLDRPFLIFDTGGWEHTAEGMSARVVEQAERAVSEADLVVFVVDVTVGALEDDERYARLLRRSDVPVLLVANKVDSNRQQADVHDLYALGLGEPFPVSALHGRGMYELLDAVVDQLPDDAPRELPDESDIPRVAVVGRPNVGKSSLFNRLLGEQRSIVDPVPHTTRDAIDTVTQIDGEPWVFIDTAGLRRRYRHGEETELYSVDRTRRAVESADLVLFVVDASEPLGDQDQRLAALVRDAGRGAVLVLNKWDLVDEERREELERELDRLLSFASWAPRVNVSAHTGRGVGRIVPQLRRAWSSYRTRIPTSQLNTWLQEATTRVPPPPAKGSRPVRVKYITQIRTGPPTFLLFTSGPLAPQYRRYLERELRATYGFEGTPIALGERPGRDRRAEGS